MLFTIADIAEFAAAHQKRYEHDGSYRARSEHEWRRIVYEADKANKLHIVAKGNRLIGLCIVTVQTVRKLLYIHEIICVEDGFRTLINEAKKRYPEFDFAGLRNNNKKTYKKEKLWAAIHRA